jgi:hypothetical protein
MLRLMLIFLATCQIVYLSTPIPVGRSVDGQRGSERIVNSQSGFLREERPEFLRLAPEFVRPRAGAAGEPLSVCACGRPTAGAAGSTPRRSRAGIEAQIGLRGPRIGVSLYNVMDVR